MKKQSNRTRAKKTTRVISEISAGAVVFLLERKEIKILALVQNNPSGEEWFDMPKGKVERGESTVAAAQREIREEIGLTLHLDTNFREENDYVFTRKDKTGNNMRVNKKVYFFLASMNDKDKRQISISWEHKRYYFLPIDEAIQKAKYENQRGLLKKARRYIMAHYLLHKVN